MPLFPTHDSDPPASDFFISPWPHPITGQKWTSELVADETYRWTQYKEPATSSTTEIAWGEVTGKPTTFAPSAHTHDDRYYTESEIDTALSGKQPTGDYATNTALSSGLAGKAPASGISPSAITGTAVVTDDSRLSDARTPTAHTHAASEITGTAVVLSGAQTITGSKTFSSLTTNGTVVFGAGSTFFADTAAANSARSALGVARGIETVGSSQAAVVGGRYITTAAVTITDPTTRIDGSALQDGDSYEVWIGGPGNATIDGVAYVPSRFSIRRARISGSWTTPAATVTGAFNATSVSGNGSALTNLSWAAIGGTGTAASPSFTAIGATTPGTGAFTTVTASGTVSGNGSTLNGINLVLATDARLSRRAAGIMMIDQNGTANGALVLASNTSSGVSIKRSGTTLQVRLGDDSADAPLSASNLTASGTLAVTGATTLTGGVILPTSTTPASATAAGVAGTICRDANYIYVCTATNTWKRVAISTW